MLIFFIDFVQRGSQVFGFGIAGVTQLVESQPSKLLVAGSSPVSRSIESLGRNGKNCCSSRNRLRSSAGRARPW